MADRRRLRDVLLFGARLALLFASVGIVGLFAEAALRLSGYEAIYSVYSKPSLFWTKDPVLGWKHERNGAGRYRGPRPWPVEFDSEVRLNSLGLRGPEIEPVAPGGLRILFTGDSMVAGFEVAQEDTFVVRTGQLLAERLGRPVQTLNAGVRGYGTDQTYLWYRDHAAELAPDWVVFMHSGNDPDDNTTLHRMRRPFGKAAFHLDDTGALELVGAPVPDYPACSQYDLDADYRVRRLDSPLQRAYCAVEVNLADRSALFTWATFRLRENAGALYWIWRFALPAPKPAAPPAAGDDAVRAAIAAAPANAFEFSGGGSGRASDAQYRLTSALLRAYAAAVRDSRARLFVIVGRAELARLDAAAIEAEGALLRSLDIPDSEIGGRPIQWKNDGHYNELGHALGAKAIADALTPLLRAEALPLSAPSG